MTVVLFSYRQTMCSTPAAFLAGSAKKALTCESIASVSVLQSRALQNSYIRCHGINQLAAQHSGPGDASAAMNIAFCVYSHIISAMYSSITAVMSRIQSSMNAVHSPPDTVSCVSLPVCSTACVSHCWCVSTTVCISALCVS